jgi:hypothetical protein
LCLEFKQEKTIGEIIQEQTWIPKDSFHQFYNKEGLTRIDIMSNIGIKFYTPEDLKCRFYSTN